MGKAYIIKFIFVLGALQSDPAEFKHLLKSKTVFFSYAFLILGNHGVVISQLGLLEQCLKGVSAPEDKEALKNTLPRIHGIYLKLVSFKRIIWSAVRDYQGAMKYCM